MVVGRSKGNQADTEAKNQISGPALWRRKMRKSPQPEETDQQERKVGRHVPEVTDAGKLAGVGKYVVFRVLRNTCHETQPHDCQSSEAYQ